MELQPDQPFAFGYKISWFAIRTKDCEAVADALDLTDRRPANWAVGIDAAYRYFSLPPKPFLVFVSPPIDGWTFAASFGFPTPVDTSHRKEHLPGGRAFRRLLLHLAARFDEVQFFASHRVADYYAWARTKAGRIERLCSYADGGVSSNEGRQTPEEARLGFLDLGERHPLAATDYLWQVFNEMEKNKDASPANSPRRRILLNENDVTDLAGEWSLDPTKIAGMQGEVRLGYIGLMKALG